MGNDKSFETVVVAHPLSFGPVPPPIKGEGIVGGLYNSRIVVVFDG